MLVGLRTYLVSWQVTDSAASSWPRLMRSNTGREISKEKRGPTRGANNRAMAKNIKYSVSRLITAVTGHRHKTRYQTNSSIGTNDRSNGENIVAITKAIATYIFKKTTVPQL